MPVILSTMHLSLGQAMGYMQETLFVLYRNIMLIMLVLAGADFLYQRGFVPEDAAPQEFWQLHNTYILAQVTSGYVIVDQHAAHERILFEEVMKGREDVAPQGLLFPITLELTADEFEAYERAKDRLA